MAIVGKILMLLVIIVPFPLFIPLIVTNFKKKKIVACIFYLAILTTILLLILTLEAYILIFFK